MATDGLWVLLPTLSEESGADGKTRVFISIPLERGREQHIALPIFALFLKKVYADPQFGIMEADVFERPAGFNLELDCDKAEKSPMHKEEITIRKVLICLSE